MAGTILVACDLSGTSRAVAEAGVWLGERLGSRVKLLHVDGYGHLLSERFHAVDEAKLDEMSQAYQQNSVEQLRHIVDKLHLEETGIDIEVRAGRIEDEIVRAAAEPDVELVVVGSRSRVNHKLVASGTALRVVRHAIVPVAMVDVEHTWSGISKILYATDLERGRLEVDGWAARLTAATGAHLDLLHVSEVGGRFIGPYVFPEPTLSTYHSLRSKDLERLKAEISQRAIEGGAVKLSVDTHLLVSNDPAVAILETANRLQSELIVVGTHGRGRLARWMLGSVTEEILYQAGCSVFSVRESDFEE